jgi:hypothetical protein
MLYSEAGRERRGKAADEGRQMQLTLITTYLFKMAQFRVSARVIASLQRVGTFGQSDGRVFYTNTLKLSFYLAL